MTSTMAPEAADLGPVRLMIDEMLQRTTDRVVFESSEIQDFCLDLRSLVDGIEAASVPPD